MLDTAFQRCHVVICASPKRECGFLFPFLLPIEEFTMVMIAAQSTSGHTILDEAIQ